MYYLRFVISRRHQESNVSEGLLSAVYEQSRRADLPEASVRALRAHLDWFEANLKKPTRFARSRAKGNYRRDTRGVSWLKDSATGHIARMFALTKLVEELGVPVSVLRDRRVGYVVYEDEFQVVAEPFATTRVNPS